MGLPKLADFGYNKYSQWGEDGIIEKIFEVMGTQSKVCIEFGAADGFLLSNTAKLWTNEGWYGILIEADPRQAEKLIKNVAKYPCKAIIGYIGNEAHNSLEAILRAHDVFPEAVDVLSIDIDSDDYYVFESLQDLRPRLIICEYNPTIPAEYDIRFPYGTLSWGCSAGALIRIAKTKGYELIAMTDTNCFFVRSEDIEKFAHFETRLEKIQIKKYLKFLSTNYAGAFIIAGEWEKTPYGIYNQYNGKVLCNDVFLHKILYL